MIWVKLIQRLVWKLSRCSLEKQFSGATNPFIWTYGLINRAIKRRWHDSCGSNGSVHFESLSLSLSLCLCLSLSLSLSLSLALSLSLSLSLCLSESVAVAFSTLARIWGEGSMIHCLPALLFFFFLKKIQVEISWRPTIPLFRPESFHSGSASWDDWVS